MTEIQAEGVRYGEVRGIEELKQRFAQVRSGYRTPECAEGTAGQEGDRCGYSERHWIHSVACGSCQV